MYHVFDVALFANSCGDVKLYDIPANTTAINITACSGTKKIQNRIADQALSWSQAVESCKTMKLGAVSDTLPNWVSGTDIRKYLEDINYKNLNYTFWFGIFRPHLHVRKWYSFRGACKEYTYTNPSGDPNNGQCAIIRRNELETFHESIHVEDCNEHYPYVCNRYHGCNYFLAYKGFDVIESPLGANRIDMPDVSLNVCKAECYDSSFCNSFSYSDDLSVCTLYERRKGYAALNYTVNMSSSSNVTHYAKTGCVVEFMSNTTHVSESYEILNLPDCGVDEVPPTYCPCKSYEPDENVTVTGDIVNDIIRNLTIDRKSTASYQRRLKSSTDDRKASKAFGTLGILVIIGTLSLLVLADIFLPLKTKSNKNKKK
ncbi:uncharacterized protein LOC123527479 [Mercenaria mercenaria]|uniref:uncharacterized protein LOC123527479 n=1 Tax=Mercenaria mercenaria TaxID=6596 RepID=UPI00234E52AF|nr:uncharacterized protein LOC123527479 [Mercenaria mercenaria]